MAIADSGGTALGRNVRILVADHQNKPDIGASKFREWADQKGLNFLIAGSNTAVAIAMAKLAAETIPCTSWRSSHRKSRGTRGITSRWSSRWAVRRLLVP